VNRVPHPLLAVTALAIALAGCAASATTKPGPSKASPPPGSATTPAPASLPTGTPSATPAPAASPIGTLGPTASPDLTPPARAATPVLVVTGEGGFIAASAGIGALPEVAVYADGRIVTPAGPRGDGTLPLIAGAEVRNVGSAGIAAITTAIRAAHLDAKAPNPSDAPVGIPGDTGTQVFRVTLDGSAPIVTRIASGAGPGRPGGGNGSGSSAEALALLARLEDTSDPWGAPSASPEAYTADGWLVFAAPDETAPSPDGSPVPGLNWPLATKLDEFGAPSAVDRGVVGLRQGVVRGADAATLAAALGPAAQGASIGSGGSTWHVWIRPLLPDELP
jgi:hypothetical protein